MAIQVVGHIYKDRNTIEIIVPSAPTSIAASGTGGTVTVTWGVPVSDGGSAITGYLVARDGTDINGFGPYSTTINASTFSFTFTNLAPGTTYTLTVSGVTAFGTGTAARTTYLNSTGGEPSTSFIVTDPSMDIQTMLNTAGAGATVVIRAGGTGIYKQYGKSIISPPVNQNVWLAAGVRIDGCRTVTGWTSDGSGHWSASGYLPSAYSVDSGTQSEIISGTNANLAGYREQMFLDGVRLQRVGALTLVTTGTFWQDYATNNIWVGADPTGHLLEMSATATAVNITNTGVTWTGNGSVIQRFANVPQSGAFNVRASGCSIVDLVTEYNHAAGAYFASAGNSTRTGGRDSYNGQIGMSRYNCSGSIIDSVEFSFNNPQGLYRIMDWESGGIKCSQNTQGDVRNCYSHENRGLGYWHDVSNRSESFTNCEATLNSADGARLEIGWGSQVIGGYYHGDCIEQVTKFDGTAVRGSDPGPFFSDEININDSASDANNGNKPTLISGVRIVAVVNDHSGTGGNKGGVNGMFAQARPRSSGGVTWTLAATITGCDIKIPTGGRIGAGNLSGADYSQVFYTGNKYRVVSSSASYFQIGNTSPISFASWQAAGQDATGTLIVEP